MSDTSLTNLQDRYQLELQLLRLERQRSEYDLALRHAKFDLRAAQEKIANQSGALQRFVTQLWGKTEETELQLRRQLAEAEAELASAQRQKEILDVRLPELKEQLAALPDWNSLNDGSAEWSRLEALYCLEVLGPQLEVNRELLTERRNQFNGSYAGEIKTRQDLSEIYSAPEAAGEACRPYLLRLKAALDALAVPFELHSYFNAPTAFLSSATQYTRMDRINTAIGEVQALQKLIPKLKAQLER